MRAEILENTGPRIIGLEVEGIGQLMGYTEMSVDGQGGHVPLIGGHRFWSAPETRAGTYVPDTTVKVSRLDGGLRVESDDPRLPVVKTLEIRSVGDRLLVDHILVNQTPEPIEVAAWGLTMVRPGGTVSIPAPDHGLGEEGLQARFSVVTWPYTDLRDPRLILDQSGISIDVSDGPQFKIGAGNYAGRVEYTMGRTTFVKSVDRYDPKERYVDLGAAIQVYMGHGFCELETVGPLRSLDVGESLTHRETWEIRTPS